MDAPQLSVVRGGLKKGAVRNPVDPPATVPRRRDDDAREDTQVIPILKGWARVLERRLGIAED